MLPPPLSTIPLLLTLTHALPDNNNNNNNPPPTLRQQQELARNARIEAFNAQKPLHTTALLAGAAAAAPTPAAYSNLKTQANAHSKSKSRASGGSKVKANAEAKVRDMRVRDLRTVTGEGGMWVNLEDVRDTLRAVVGEDREEKEEEEEEEEEEERVVEDDEGYAERVREKVISVARREGWDARAGGGEM